MNQAEREFWRIKLLRRTGGIYEAAERVFGTWREALKSAGLVKGDGPIVQEGRELLLPCRLCGRLAIPFMVRAVTQDVGCPRCGGNTHVEARREGERWVIQTG